MSLLETIFSGLMAAVVPIVSRVLAALGVSFVVYEGADLSLGFLESQLISNFSSMPAMVISFMGILQLDTCITIMLGAIAFRIALKTLTGFIPFIGIS